MLKWHIFIQSKNGIGYFDIRSVSSFFSSNENALIFKWSQWLILWYAAMHEKIYIIGDTIYIYIYSYVFSSTCRNVNTISTAVGRSQSRKAKQRRAKSNMLAGIDSVKEGCKVPSLTYMIYIYISHNPILFIYLYKKRS